VRNPGLNNLDPATLTATLQSPAKQLSEIEQQRVRAAAKLERRLQHRRRLAAAAAAATETAKGVGGAATTRDVRADVRQRVERNRADNDAKLAAQLAARDTEQTFINAVTDNLDLGTFVRLVSVTIEPFVLAAKRNTAHTLSDVRPSCHLHCQADVADER
jgi:hypothetical protein